MKTVFEDVTRTELIRRINALHENTNAQWGKMNVYQTARHCTQWDAWVHGRNNPTYTRSLLGRIFGKWALKSSVKDGTPMQRNIPTSRDLVIREKSGDLIGIFAYKHADHHLRQFNC